MLAVVVTPDGRRAVSASDDKTLKVWDLQAGTLNRATFFGEAPFTVAAWAPNARRIVAGDDAREVHFLDWVES